MWLGFAEDGYLKEIHSEEVPDEIECFKICFKIITWMLLDETRCTGNC